MIIIKAFIEKAPDDWEPDTVWFLAAIETLIEAFLLGIFVYFIRGWIGI